MRILLLCGESTLAPLLARQLIIRAPYYRVTAVVEKAAQRKPFKKMTEKFGPGPCKLLVNNLKGITCERDARLIVEKARAEWVVWVSGEAGDAYLFFKTFGSLLKDEMGLARRDCFQGS